MVSLWLFIIFLLLNEFVQPAYHSKKNEDGDPEVCACAMCPFKTEFKGPADSIEEGNSSFYFLAFSYLGWILGKEDIIDEVLNYFRANVLFRNFEVKGGADRTLIYLTLHAVQCLVVCEKIEDKNSGKTFNVSVKCLLIILSVAVRQLRELSKKQFAIPGENGWPLGGLFPAPTTKAEGG